MTITTLSVPYRDTCAADLRYRLGGPREPALAERRVRLDLAGHPYELRLAVLGHSHQVDLVGPGIRLRETVAYQPDREPHLPASRTRDADGHCYRFGAEVSRPGDLGRALAARFGEVSEEQELCAGFPGHPDALTALTWSLDDHGRQVRWQTLHAYPGTGELVRTVSRVRRFEEAR